MLTSRGEHFYLLSNSADTLNYASARSAPACQTNDLARPHCCVAEPRTVVPDDLGDESGANPGYPRFAPFPSISAAGDTLGLEADPGCRGGVYSRQGGQSWVR